mmetsp:Transcript_16410/g.29644  ORF Transcript_16410/g.29644 Transcript_16410/m.29644 type:complete len:107 (+) Transcript_16410:202-522(+)
MNDSSSCCLSENSEKKMCEVCLHDRTIPAAARFAKNGSAVPVARTKKLHLSLNRVHDDSPLTWEDEYGRRGRPEQCSLELELDRCFSCQKRGCSACLTSDALLWSM